MVDLFDKMYNSIKDKNKTLSLLRFYSVIRIIIRLSANLLLPFYFLLTRKNKKYSLLIPSSNKERIIVSITSFPSRINRIWLVIETLLHQSKKPDKIILWLSLEQFPSLKSLPENLLSLQKRGLEIQLKEDNLRSHKKYYYAIKDYPDDIIITVDDDVFYHTELIENLVNLYHKFPTCVCCNYCSEIEVVNKEIEPYLSWKNYYIPENPGFKLFPIGIGGILYPPGSLHPLVIDSTVFKSICLNADDIWLNCMTKLAENLVVKTNYNSFYLPVINYKNSSLTSVNVNEGYNDKQLSALRKYCIIKLGKDPFEKILLDY